MLQWMQAHKDLVPWLSAGLTFLAIAIALAHPTWRSRRERLDALIGYRNLALIAHRFVSDSLTKALQGEWHPNGSLDYATCIKALDAIKFENISPAYLTVHFVEIWHMTKRGELYIAQQNSKPGEIAETIARSASAMEGIDSYLRSKRVHFDGQNFARRRPVSRPR